MNMEKNDDVNLTSITNSVVLFTNGNSIDPPHHDDGADDGDISYDIFQDVFYVVLTPAVSLFGCVGNILNIIALIRSRQKMKKADGGRDSGTLLGLLVLAVSDMLFCAAVFPRALLELEVMRPYLSPMTSDCTTRYMEQVSLILSY